MSSEKAWNMFVFRDGRRTVSGATLAQDLAEAVRSVGPAPQQDPLISALLRAGEFECALIDAGSCAADNVATITDTLADLLLGGSAAVPLGRLVELIPADPPKDMRISPPEGFAYYALHPLDYSDMAAKLSIDTGRACVVGIRSIGVTLSALVAAALRLRGLRVVRTTVRPEGHPYNRQTRLDSMQLAMVRALSSVNAEFIVADEGPGMSGSSFLSVGDCLVDAGVRRDRIVFLCSRVPDPDNLRAANAGERWRSYSSLHANKNSRLPDAANLYLGGGNWRKVLLGAHFESPATWTQMERLKFLSSDRKTIFKFEGFGRFGEVVHRRAERIAEAGFGPRPFGFSNGFSSYPVIDGRPLTADDLSPELIDRMADYCAFRSREFACGPDEQDATQLEEMVQFNLSEEFGMQSPLEPGSLVAVNPIIADGKMMPYEWIATASGDFLKLDASSHGDDHFFPGPTDIAWDLAGAIVEWQMDDRSTERFVSRYENRTGDNVRERLNGFLLAYAVFRMGYCSMAAASTHEPHDHALLSAAYRSYRNQLEYRLKTAGMSLSVQ